MLLTKQKPTSLSMRKIEAELARYLREEFKRQGREIIKFLKKNKVFDALYDDAKKRWEPYVYEKSQHRPYKESGNAKPPPSVIVRMLAGAQAAIGNVKKTAKQFFLSKRKAADIGGQTALGNLGISVNFKLQNPKMLDALMQRGTKITGVIDQNTIQTVRKTLVREYYQAGEDITRAARALKAEKKLNYLFENTYKRRAMTIARTETRTAQMGVQHETYGRNGVQSKYWIATNDLKTRESHVMCGSQGPIPWEQPYINGLQHPLDPTGPPEEVINCFLPGTLVSGDFTGGSKAFYSGKCVEIKTLRGNRCSTTINHPVMTLERGWVPSHKVKKGETLITYRPDVVGGVLGDVDNENREALIQDVFYALGSYGRPFSKMVKVLDFHGDGKSIQDKVDIVVCEGLLGSELDSTPAKGLHDNSFSFPRVIKSTLMGEGAFNFCFRRVHAPPSLTPSGKALSFDLGSVVFNKRPLHFLSFGAASNFDVVHYEIPADGLPCDADNLGNLFNAHPVKILFDKVVDVREFDFSGHVYDLQSLEGVLFANGILYHNCRCDEGIIRPDTVFCKAESTEPCTEPWTGGPEPKAGTSSRRLTPREKQMQTVYARPADQGGIGMMELMKLPEREHRVVLKLIERGRISQARRILAQYSGRTVQTIKSMPTSAWKKSRQAFIDCGGA